MEGYSVTEAAAVLGVPTERVWELLARGVLAGQPDGESGMRVFLQPRAAAAPSRMEMPPPAPQPAREPERELSPFRELLTEFRNLTERYGQALLALGEARGEVASLRSRVDLLEARMDLRLPMTPPAVAPPIGWEAPESTERREPLPPREVEPPRNDDTVTVPPTAPDEAAIADEAEPASEVEEVEDVGAVDAADGVEEIDDGEERHRRRRAHHATESFAEALARAEDPTVPELPEPYRESVAQAHDQAPPSEAAAPDAALPRELPVAEPMPTVDDEEEPAGIPFVEPSPVTDGTLDAPTAPSGVDVAAIGVVHDGSEVDRGLDAAGELESWPSDVAPRPADAEAAMSEVSDDAGEVRSETGADADAEPASDQTDAPAEPEAARDDRPAVPASPLDWDPERYTTAIGEPDWYAEEEEVTPPAPAAAPLGEAERPREAADEPEEAADEPWIAREVADVAAEEPELAAEEPELATHEPEAVAEESEAVADAPAGAAFEPEGSAEMEVAPAAQVPQPEPAASATGDDALAALDALARSSAPQATSIPRDPWSATAERRDEPEPTPIDPARAYRQGLASRPVPPPTSASRAYRRLRRIFPG